MVDYSWNEMDREYFCSHRWDLIKLAFWFELTLSIEICLWIIGIFVSSFEFRHLQKMRMDRVYIWHDFFPTEGEIVWFSTIMSEMKWIRNDFVKNLKLEMRGFLRYGWLCYINLYKIYWLHEWMQGNLPTGFFKELIASENARKYTYRILKKIWDSSKIPIDFVKMAKQEWIASENAKKFTYRIFKNHLKYCNQN